MDIYGNIKLVVEILNFKGFIQYRHLIETGIKL